MASYAPSKSILIFTCSEFGQANVNLAVLYELLRIKDGFDIHIASHKSLETRVRSVSADLDRHATFHAIPGPTIEDLAERHAGEMSHAPGLAIIEAFGKIPNLLAGYDPEEYHNTYLACVKVIQDVRPACALVDTAFFVGFDACATQNLPAIRISPTLLFHVVLQDSPGMQVLWKYPFVASGLSYPIPWYWVPFNIYVTIRSINRYLSCKQTVKINKFRKETLGIDMGIPLNVHPGSAHLPRLSAGLPELEFPMHIPKNVKPCGPMVLPNKPIQNIDPELAAWLEQGGGGTILVQMGTHWDTDGDLPSRERKIAGIAQGLRILLDQVPDVQVLWKLQTAFSSDVKFDTASNNVLLPVSVSEPLVPLVPHMSRVRITGWLKPNPSAVLESRSSSGKPHTIAVVHHGGGNSFWEATRAGIPQVILPAWYDCYEFAVRADYTGIGLWGNQTVAPRVDGKELGKALVKVVKAEAEKGGVSIREKAWEMGEIVRAKGEGREIAAEEVLKVARESMKGAAGAERNGAGGKPTSASDA